MTDATMMAQNNGAQSIRLGGSLEELEAIYKIYGKLGSGGYGQVYRGIRRSDRFPVAVKVVEKKRVPKWCEVNGHRIPNEVSLHARVHHLQGIVAMLDHFKCPDGNHVLVMERPDPVMDLFDFITYNGALDETVARVFFRQLVHTVVRCHEAGVVHRDIKDENVLINVKTGQLYLIDFGSSATMQAVCYEKFDAGTRVYCPPEWVRHELFHPVFGTTWSLGVLLYDMLCGDIPFENETQIIAGHLSWDRVGSSAAVSAVAKDLVRRLLTGAMEHRLTLDGILSHPWIQSPLPPIFGAMPSANGTALTPNGDTVDNASALMQHQALTTEANAFDYCFRNYAAKAIKKHHRKTGIKLLEGVDFDDEAGGGIELLQQSHQQVPADVHYQQQQQLAAGAASAPAIKFEGQQQFQLQPPSLQAHQQQAELAELIGDQPTSYSQPHFIIGEDDDEIDGSFNNGSMIDDNGPFHFTVPAELIATAPVVPLLMMPSLSSSRQLHVAEPLTITSSNHQQILEASIKPNEQQVGQERLLMQRLNSIDSATTSASTQSVDSIFTAGSGAELFLPNIASSNNFNAEVPSTPPPATYYFGTDAAATKNKQASSGYGSAKDSSSIVMSPEIIESSSSSNSNRSMPPSFMASQNMRSVSNSTLSPMPPATLNLTAARSTLAAAVAGRSPAPRGGTANAATEFVFAAPLQQQQQQQQQQRLIPAAHLRQNQQVMWQQNHFNNNNRHSLMVLYANNNNNKSPHPYQHNEQQTHMPPPIMRAFSVDDHYNHHSPSSSSSASSSPSSSAAGNVNFSNPRGECNGSLSSVMSSPDTYYDLRALEQIAAGISNSCINNNNNNNNNNSNDVGNKPLYDAVDSSSHSQLRYATSTLPASSGSSSSTINNRNSTPNCLMPFNMSPVHARQPQVQQQHAMTWPSTSFQLAARFMPNDGNSVSESCLMKHQQQQQLINNNHGISDVVFAYRQPIVETDSSKASMLPPPQYAGLKQQQFVNYNKVNDGFHSPASMMLMSANNNPAPHHQQYVQYQQQQAIRANNDDVVYYQQQNRPAQHQQFRSPAEAQNFHQQQQFASAMYLAAQQQQQQQQYNAFIHQQQQNRRYEEPFCGNGLLTSSMQNQTHSNNNLAANSNAGQPLPSAALVQHIWSKVAPPASATTSASSSNNNTATTTHTFPSTSSASYSRPLALLAHHNNPTSCTVQQQQLQQQQHHHHHNHQQQPHLICKIDSGISLSSHLTASSEVSPVL